MSALFQFIDVQSPESRLCHSFVLHSGEIRLLQLASKNEKDVLLDWCLGETDCLVGSIEIAQEDRRQKSVLPADRKDRRKRVQLWQAVKAGRIGWVAGNGGLISNLKIWENVTLPLWYHSQCTEIETEQRVLHWLGVLGLTPSEFADFMALPPASAEVWQRKLAGLLRALVQMSPVLIVDGHLFDDINSQFSQCWIAALEAYAAQERAVLVLTDKASSLLWQKIE